MLKRLGETEKCVDPSGAVVRIRDAAFPAPFLSELEFNAPVHGTWNIVHTGMLIPEGHTDLCLCGQLYAGRCADRGGDECSGSFFFCDSEGERFADG